MLSKLVKLTILSFIIVGLVFLRGLFPNDKEKASLLFYEDFEDMPQQQWFSDDLHIKKESDDIDSGLVVRQIYQPSSTGTPFIGKRFKLSNRVNEAVLSFDMKIDSQFEFVKGGKLHGLGGGNATTGCKPIDPDGWSVRLMWRQEGRPVLYLYHQDRKNRCGDDIAPKGDFTFEKEKWHRISIYVKLNSAVGSADGVAALIVDGNKLVETKGLNFTGNMSSPIDYFMYNSFYGGNDPSWSPSRATFIEFDNFKVTKGSVENVP